MINDLPSSEARASIARKAGRGIFWNFLSYGLGKGTVLLTTAILARLLSKEDFGLIAVALVALNYLAVVKDLGLGPALIQRRQGVEEAANTVFTFNVLVGITLSLLLFPLAPWIAAYFNEPRITPVVRWLGLSFAINALGATHVNLLMRELDYRRKFIADMGNTIVKGGISIGLALSGFGVWSLVFGQLAGALTAVLLVWLIFPWRPRPVIHRHLLGELFRFGASVTGIDILGVIIDNLSYVIVGKVFGMAALGLFSIAYRLPEMLIIANLWLLTAVVFPAFAALQDRPEELRRGFLFSIHMVELLVMPLSLGLWIAAEPVVRVVFGEQWLEAVPLLRILAIFALVYSIGYHAGDIYKAIGRPDILLKLSIVGIFIYIPAMWIGARYGLIGLAWGYLISMIIEQLLRIAFAMRFVHVTAMDILKEMRPAAQAALFMVMIAAGVLTLTQHTGSILQLGLVVTSGAIAYLSVVWLTERNTLIRLTQVVLSRPKA